MRTMQEILNVVIESGVYRPLPTNDFYIPFHMVGYGSYYMCDCVDHCYQILKLISEDEHTLVIDNIRKYIDYRFSLEGVLYKNNLPSSFESRLVIYKDWDNRPKLKF
jgi:hypothetical protein